MRKKNPVNQKFVFFTGEGPPPQRRGRGGGNVSLETVGNEIHPKEMASTQGGGKNNRNGGVLGKEKGNLFGKKDRVFRERSLGGGGRGQKPLADQKRKRGGRVCFG